MNAEKAARVFMALCLGFAIFCVSLNILFAIDTAWMRREMNKMRDDSTYVSEPWALHRFLEVITFKDTEKADEP